MFPRSLAFIVALASCGFANAAGFDCTKAASVIEKQICADAYLSRLDYQLSVAFSDAQPSYRGIDGDTGARIDPLGEDQRRWLRDVRNNCQDPVCLQKVYEARIEEIKSKWPPR